MPWPRERRTRSAVYLLQRKEKKRKEKKRKGKKRKEFTLHPRSVILSSMPHS